MPKPKMWRPRSLGDVIAERRISVKIRRRQHSIVVKFGRPLRSSDPRDPWWTPFSISGAGIDRFTPVAGQDSLQSLLLALDHAADLLASEVRALGGQPDWLGESERLILAPQAMSKAVEGALISLIADIRRAAVFLDSGSDRSKRKKARAMDAIDAIGASAGYWSARGPRRKRSLTSKS